MKFSNQIVVILLCYCISFFFSRLFLYGLKKFKLNRSAYKKRKKEETFKEWLFYCRYKKEIPKVLRFLYYFVLIFHPVVLVICTIISFIEIPVIVDDVLTISTVVFDCVLQIAFLIFFWSPKPGVPYDRWFNK